MTARRRLPNRRASVNVELVVAGLRYTATFSRYPDGLPYEVFLQNHKPGSQSDFHARDAAIVASLALQHGVPLETIRRALLRDPQGRASTPLGVALDLIAGSQP